MHILAPILLVPLLAGLSPRPLEAQADSVHLRVRVIAHGRALAGATVTAAGASRVTGPGGEASFRLPPGTVEVGARRVGFEASELRVTLVAGRDTTITLALAPAAEELEDVVVNVTRSGRRVADQPTRIEVIGPEEIAEKVLMTPGDISMLLNETGGLRVQNTSPSLGGAGVRVQGLRGRYTLLLSDGLPLHAGGGGPGLLQVPPMDLGQVEVLKGTASALYGSAALAGAVNLVSRQPSGERELLANVTSRGGTDAATWVSGLLGDDWGWSLYGGWHRQDRRDLDADGWTDLAGYRRGVVRPRLHFRDERGQSLLATAGLVVESREGGTLPGRTAPDGEPWPEAARTVRADAGVNGRLAVSDAVFLSVRAAGVTQAHRHAFGLFQEPDHHTTALVESAVTAGVGRVHLVAGVAWQGDWYRSEAVRRFDFTHSVPGVFAQVEWDPSPLVGIGLSSRLDRHNEYGTFASPRLNLVLRPAEGWTARLSGGAGWHGPTPLVEEVEATGLRPLRQLAPLRAERVVGGSADVSWHRGPFELGGTLFASRIAHPVAATPMTGPQEGLLLLANQAEPVRTVGAELLARVHHEGLHLTASYAWVHATEGRDGEARQPVPLNPRHALGLVGMHEWEETMRIGLELYAVGRQRLDENPYRDESPAYLVLGALVERSIAGVRWFVNFENLTGVRQTSTDPLVRPARGPGGRWTVDAWAPLEGRVINGGVRLGW